MKDQQLNFPIWAMPWWQQQQQPPRHDNCYNQVPARVEVAMEFLTNLTLKTMTRGMANDVGMQEIQGQELLPVENETQAAACNMLTKYFEGKLKPTDWEYDAAAGPEHPNIIVGYIQCPSCNDKEKLKPACSLCKGDGRLGLTREKE